MGTCRKDVKICALVWNECAAIKSTVVILYGHNLGGMIVQEYCSLNHVPAPGAIILQNCSYTNPLNTMPMGKIIRAVEVFLIDPLLIHISSQSKLFTFLGLIAYTSGLSSMFYRMLLFGGKQSAKTLRAMARFAAITKAKTTVWSLMEAFEFDASKSLGKIKVPCLVLGAKSDKFIALAAAVQIHHMVCTSELVLLNGGHQTLAEYPELTNQAVQKFLQRYNMRSSWA